MAGLFDLSTLKIPGMNPATPVAGMMAQPQQQAVAPVPQQATGLLDGLFAAKAPHQATNWDRMSLLGATLRDMGAGLRGSQGDAIQKAQAAIASEDGVGAAGAANTKKGAAYNTADLYKVAQTLFPGDPKAQFLWTTQNSDFLKDTSNASYGFHDVAGGNSYGSAAGGFNVAPKLVDHDGQYGTQGAGGYVGTGQAAPSYTDQIGAAREAEAGRHNLVDEGQGQRRIGIEAQQAGTAAAHLGIDRQQLTLGQQKFGHELAPNAPVISSADDYAKIPSGTQYVTPDGHLRVKR